MTKYEDIWEMAIDHHGLISSSEARSLGVSNHEMVEYARRGRLEHVAHGLYRLVHYVPSESDPYAFAVKLVSPESYLYGESVIALLGLAPTNPSRMFVATPRRVRKRLPKNMRLVYVPGGEPGAVYEGIPSQRVADAIRSSLPLLGRERVIDAALEGHRLGYLRNTEMEELLEEIGRAEAAK